MYFGLLIMIGCAVAYYRIGELEYGRGVLLAGASVLVWCGTSFGLGWGWLSSVGAQVAIFFVLIGINMFRGPGFS